MKTKHISRKLIAAIIAAVIAVSIGVTAAISVAAATSVQELSLKSDNRNFSTSLNRDITRGFDLCILNEAISKQFEAAIGVAKESDYMRYFVYDRLEIMRRCVESGTAGLNPENLTVSYDLEISHNATHFTFNQHLILSQNGKTVLTFCDDFTEPLEPGF